MTKDKNTEQRIFDAARTIFQQKGLAGARMQEIADEAGINKALLHYYFRNKEKLFEAIFNEVFTNISSGLEMLFTKEMGVMDRFRIIVEIYIDNLLKNPHIPLFVINEMNQNPEKILATFEQKVVVHLRKFLMQIYQEINEGKIRKVDPFHLLMSVIGMIVFPFIAYPGIKGIAENSQMPGIENFLLERKKVVIEYIENILKP
jgi:TetR/AcrR family transcriptional regulator